MAMLESVTIDPIVIPTPGRPWTRDDLLARQGEGHRYELIRGELRQMAPASLAHGAYEGHLFYAIAAYLRTNPIGLVVPGDTGFELQSNPLTIRSPDIAFIAQERIPSDRSGFPSLAPDLVVEIISPSETARLIAEKISDYLQAGTRMLWIVYPEQRQVQEYRQDGAFRIYRQDSALDGQDVLPGFSYPLAELFAL